MFKGYVGQFKGFDIIQSPDIPIVKKYPNGKKDGNKVGKRKSKHKVYSPVYYEGKIILHEYMNVDDFINDLNNNTKKSLDVKDSNEL
jgi:hypothetical protein